MKRFGDNTVRVRPQRGYQVVSTGSLALDYAMGCGGYVVGRITEIWGTESVAKTTMAMIAAANFQKQFKTRSVAWVNMERTFDWKWAETHGIDPNRLVLMEPENSEDVADMAKMAISSGLFSLVVLDSVGGMVTREEMEKVADKDSVGTAAKVVTRMVKIAAVLCADTDTTMIIINQTRANIGFAGGTTTGGGFALKHVTTHKIKLRRTQTEAFTVGAKDDKQTVGIELAATVEKNKVAPPRRTATFALFVAPTVKYGPVGIDRATEAFTVGVRTGAIEQFGAWYHVPGMDGRIQGREAVLAALRANPALLDKVRKGMLDHIADEVADEVPEADDVVDDGEVLDFATGALTEDFEPDQEILAKLQEQAP
jgi:recombination protein RecA